MDTALVLFLLRTLSAFVLLLLLAAFFYVMWRDFAVATQELDANRRVHGRLVRVREIDGKFMATPEAYPLMPLTSFGRAPTNAVQVEDTFASADHALVALRNGRWWLEDRQSTNGTLLNGVPIDQPVIITEGDLISIGQTHYRLELEE